MKLSYFLLYKLDSLGYYGRIGLSAEHLMQGIKGYEADQVEECMIDLFQKGFIIITNSDGWPSFSLNPRKCEEIDQYLENAE